MRRKMKLRTKLTIAILVMLMLFTCFTTACKPVERVPDTRETPQNSNAQLDVIDEDVLAKLSFEAPTEPYTAPAHWTETVEDGSLTIEIDTDITLPEVTKYPAARVEPLTLTQDMVNELVDYFAPNSTLYENSFTMTKAEYEKLIEEVQIGEEVDGEYVITDDTKEHIAELREQQANAPVEVPKVYVDTTLTYRTKIDDPEEPSVTEGGKNFLWVSAERSGQRDPSICVANYVEDYNERVFFGYCDILYYETESRINKVIEDEQRYSDSPHHYRTLEIYSGLKEIVAGITMTQEEAQPHAQKVLSDLGLNYMRLVNVEKAAAFKSQDEETEIPDPDVGGYVFEYMRDLGGMVGYERDGWMGGPKEEPPAYVEPFQYETVKIFVTEKGVQCFIWGGGIRITEEISDSVKLLPFDQIQQALIKQIHNKNSASLSYGRELKVEVVSAELKLGYVSTDKFRPALMVPVWVFSTIDIERVLNYRTDEYEVIDGNHNLIVINAIDGGTIEADIPE